MNRPLVRPEIAWPAFVVGLLLLGAASTFGVLYFAGSDGGPSIVANHYSDGVAWDSVATLRTAINRMGWNVSVDVGPQQASGRLVRTRLSDENGLPVDSAALSIRAFRPQTDRAVAQATLIFVGSGMYEVLLPISERGLWDFEVQGTSPAQFAERIRREL